MICTKCQKNGDSHILEVVYIVKLDLCVKIA